MELKLAGFNQYCRELMRLAQGHNMVPLVGIEPRISQFRGGCSPLCHQAPLYHSVMHSQGGKQMTEATTIALCTSCSLAKINYRFHDASILWNRTHKRCECLTQNFNLSGEPHFAIHMITILNEPRREKTGLRGFRPGPTQTDLYQLRKELEA